jgi:hypothetical protein
MRCLVNGSHNRDAMIAIPRCWTIHKYLSTWPVDHVLVLESYLCSFGKK